MAPAQRWLLSRVDRSAVDAAVTLLDKIAEQLATATADGVAIRRLASDGHALLPVAAHHPDPDRDAALAVAMGQTMDRENGLWKPVLDGPRPMRWHVPAGSQLAEANEPQARFLARFPVRAVLAVPLVHDGVVVGGVALVRFGSNRPYTEQDEALLTAGALRIAVAVAFQNEIEALSAAGS